MKIHVIVNPKAGRQVVQKNLEQIVGRLLLDGTAESVTVTATRGKDDAANAAAARTPQDTDLIIGCGGDGTMNEILNGLMRSQSGIPLAILAAGTSNDFAYSLRLPGDVDEFCNMVHAGIYRNVDVGLANGKDYFINVASFGMFTNVSHTTDRKAKNDLGRLAYYLHAANTAPVQLKKRLHLRITTDEQEWVDDYALAIVSNSMSVGSFRHLLYKADVSDGKFDVLLLQKRILPSMQELQELIHSSEQTRPTGILQYIQTSYISFMPEGENNIEEMESDLDGECYTDLPLTIQNCQQKLRVLVPTPDSRNKLLPWAEK